MRQGIIQQTVSQSCGGLAENTCLIVSGLACCRGAEEKAESPAPSKPKSVLSGEEQKVLYKRLEKYDEWTLEDYEEYRRQDAQTDGVLTYFNMPDDPNDW